MRNEEDPSAARYRAFIFDFAERSNLLVPKSVINEHTRVYTFLQACSDKIGEKLCKRCEIDLDNTETTQDVWPKLKSEALKVATKEDSQMSRLWKSKEHVPNSPRGAHSRLVGIPGLLGVPTCTAGMCLVQRCLGWQLSLGIAFQRLWRPLGGRRGAPMIEVRADTIYY